MEEWLNDTTIDGFLGNLRNYENFIVTDAKWDATIDNTTFENITRPNGTTMVTDAVGLVNKYEYKISSSGTDITSGYLHNGLSSWLLTPYNSSQVNFVHTGFGGGISNSSVSNSYGVRPSINLKSSVKIVDGDGTKDNPYRLNGDNDANLEGTLLSTRYSGEYVKFGNDENNLYRIVSHENDTGTKITSAELLKSSGTFITSAFDSNSSVNYSSNTSLGTFLNGEYLTNYVGDTYSNMIEDSTIWYLGTVGNGTLYKIAKYKDTNMSGYAESTEAKVGLLRFGELMAGQFRQAGGTTTYRLLTPASSSALWFIYNNGNASYNSSVNKYGIKPALNLKSNVIITSGDGTLQNPFQIALQ